MPVSDKHPEYRNNIESWELVRDCVKGSRQVKKKGTQYLPKPNPEDTSEENKLRYAAYKTRANYVNFTGSTKDGLLGMVFREKIQSEFPTNIEYIKDDVNGNGLTLDQFTRSVVADTIEVARHGLLVDYPPAPSGLTQAQVQALNLRANIKSYKAENIINWRTATIGGKTILTMVVLAEPTQIINEDGFSFEEKTYHRHLLLKEGIYVQNLYNEKDELLVDESGNPDIIPRNSTGSSWKKIPFVFIGAQNNDEVVDKSALYDLAEINIAHYRNSADYEESCYMVGQPTPWAAGLNQTWVKEVLKDGVMIGSRSFLLLPEGGSAGLMQAEPNQMPAEAMKDKESQMVKIGARIIEDNKTNETREGARMRFAGQTSKLGVIVGNVEAGMKKAIEFVMEFMGQGEFKLELNKEFYEATLDPQTIIAMIQLNDRGIIGKTDMRQTLRETGYIDQDRSDEDIEAEVETESPIGGMSVFP